MQHLFVAYASGTDFQKTIIEEAAQNASNTKRTITPWSAKDPSGEPIQKSVEEWIESADVFIADLSTPNFNVTYEIGYALGLQKPIRLIRSRHIDFAPVRKIGLFDTLAHDPYDYQTALTKIFKLPVTANRWKFAARNREQPIFIAQPPRIMDWSRRATSAIKKIARLKFRNFNPSEISRLTSTEAFEDVSSSFGVVTFWLDEDSDDAIKHNQRAAFIFGLARGIGIPALLLAHHSTQLPLDLHDIADRWDHLDQIDGLISIFRDDVSDELLHFSDTVTKAGNIPLRRIDFGDPVAENEQALLGEFFLETDAYNRTVAGDTNILTGRKGSGKSAIFLQARDITRSNKQNLVIDLMPEGYSLIKLKEFILDQVGYGTRKEIISAFWQYVLWLEIAYKILEKDNLRARRDPSSYHRYQVLENQFLSRVDTGTGDFSERLRILSDNIISRFQDEYGDSEIDSVKSSVILQFIYGEDIKSIRESILTYLETKGFVFFLFDNLDRFWTPGGFDADDALILIGLAEAMQEIQRKFRKDDQDFRWALFLRSDVYEFLISGMADYGKLPTQSLEWTDRDQLKALFNQRLTASAFDTGGVVTMSQISETVISGKAVLDFLVDASLMRPRYLIRLAETARRRALTLGRNKIEEADYMFGLEELGWQVLEDLDREISDLVPNSSQLIFEILSQRENLTAGKLKYIALSSVTNEPDADILIDVLLWSGAIGVEDQNREKYIYDCGYRKRYLSALIQKNSDLKVVVHPTLVATS